MHVCILKETYSSLFRENANEAFGTNGNWRDSLSDPPLNLLEFIHISEFVFPTPTSLHPFVYSGCHLSLSVHFVSFSLHLGQMQLLYGPQILPSPSPSSMAISLQTHSSFVPARSRLSNSLRQCFLLGGVECSCCGGKVGFMTVMYAWHWWGEANCTHRCGYTSKTKKWD